MEFKMKTLILLATAISCAVSFHLGEKLNRKARQAVGNLGFASGGASGLPVQVQTVDGQNITLTGGLSAMSAAGSWESNELLSANMTSYIVGQLLDLGNNQSAILLNDRKKRQLPVQTLPLGQVLNTAGRVGLSMEALSIEEDALPMMRQGFPGQALDANAATTLLIGDRKKRQATLGTIQVPTQTFTINGQNVTLAGGLSGLSMEASFGSGEVVMHPNGTLSYLQPTFTGQAVDVNNPALWLGDRKKRQVTLPGQLPIGYQTIEINGQNVTLAGGLSGLSMEASFGSGEIVMHPNGTLSYLQPTFTGQAVDVNNPALWLGDRKKRQVTLPGQLPIGYQTIEINGQNVTLAGGFSGVSMEASLGSGEFVLNSNGTLSYLQPTFTGQAVDANNAAFFLGDRKKRQVTFPGQIPISAFPTVEINGQNVTLAGGFSGVSMEASLGSGEFVLNSNGTLSYLQPTFTGQAVDANNAAFFLGDRKKRQVTFPGQIPISAFPTIEINGQNVTLAGGFSGVSMEASLGSGEFVLNSNGTLSYLQPAFTGQAVDANNAAFFLGDRKKRQVTFPGQIPISAFPTIDIGGENVTLLGSLSIASGQSLEILPQGLNFTLLGQQLNLGQLNLQQLPANTLSNLLFLDRKKRQASQEPITPEDLVLTAAAVDMQSRTLYAGAVDGDEGIWENAEFAGTGFGLDGDGDGAMEENMCVCSSQLCATWPSFINTCRKIQSNTKCIEALEQLMIIECPDAS